MHPRHKEALKFWAQNPERIAYPGQSVVGESCFKTAIKKGWLEPLIVFPARMSWWKKAYRLTEVGRAAAALAKGE